MATAIDELLLRNSMSEPSPYRLSKLTLARVASANLAIRGPALVVLSWLRQPRRSMKASSEASPHETVRNRRQPTTFLEALRSRLIELWILAVLASFFFIRILGSQTGRILSHFLRAHIS
jgi:hypothetical protein